VITFRRLLKSWATPAAQLAHRFQLLGLEKLGLETLAGGALFFAFPHRAKQGGDEAGRPLLGHEVGGSRLERVHRPLLAQGRG
jgi:hypothetical protein